MNLIQAILTIDTDNLPDNFQDILKEEQAVVARWKEEGVLSHLYLRETKMGLSYSSLVLPWNKWSIACKPFRFFTSERIFNI